jgi:hypothetical protein
VSRDYPCEHVLISPRNQDFSLLIIQQPPWGLEVSPGDTIKGSTLCDYLGGFWDSGQLHDRELLVFEGSSEIELDLNRTGSTNAALFAEGLCDEVLMFTCRIDLYLWLLARVYGSREEK